MPASTVVFVNGVNRLSPEQVRRGVDSPLASIRLRCLLPAVGLRQLGHHTALVSLPELGDPGVAEHLRDPALRVVLGKLSPGTLARHAALCATAFATLDRLAGLRPVHADVCDLLSPERGHTAAYCDLAIGRCRVVASTRWLAAHYAERCAVPPAVVEDPTETPDARPPRFAPGETLRLAWYGTWTVAAARLVRTVLDDLADLDRPIALDVVAQPDAAAEVAALGRAVAAGAGFARTVGHRSWSVAATAAALAACDLVLLPQETAQSWGLAKSHNRLVEAIQHGRLAVASPIPAYRELDGCAWVGERLADGVRWALAHPAEAGARIVAGQAEVARRFALPAVARRWAEALELPPA
ncbi:MAG: hypothetical protein IT561_08285 [Alphaproteobacteria bacterium]|nr:hypothetical protein [Alphaproteobacteria bacterium]